MLSDKNVANTYIEAKSSIAKEKIMLFANRHKKLLELIVSMFQIYEWQCYWRMEYF